MRLILLSISLTIVLALTSGCLSRSTEPVHSKGGSGSSDRMKRMSEMVYPKIKGKSHPSKTDARAAKGGSGANRKAKNSP
jgi:hypothetical protein